MVATAADTKRPVSKFGHWAYRVKDEAGATRTCTPDDFGCVITNSGGALTVTLPEPITAFSGCWIKFFSIAAGDLVIGTAAGNVLIADNDATATSVTMGLDNVEIGSSVTMVCDGTKWLTRFHPGDETSTLVIA